MRVSVTEVGSQKAALRKLGDVALRDIDPRIRQAMVIDGIRRHDPEFLELLEESTVDPLVRNTALAIVNDCADNDDECEIHSVYNAVKHGDSKVVGLERGLKYMSDPRWADFFSTPSRTLRQLAAGINGEDCDGHAALLCALLGSLGFLTALRVWGKQKGEFTHVYALVGFPKIDPNQWIALDTTVPDATPGWEPPGGHVLTAVLDGT